MRRDYFLITGLALIFFFPFLGGVHLFDQGEIALAESAREMLLTGEWMRPQIDFLPFWERPPLFLWAQAASMQIFGVNEFAARFPNALCGLFTLLLVYRIGLRLHDRMFAWLWVLAWLGSFLPHFYFRSGIIDPWFNLLVFCGLYGFIEFRWQFLTAKKLPSYWKKYRWLLLGGGLLGLAILTRGPAVYGIAIIVLGLYWARYRFRGKGYLKHFLLFSAAAWAVPGLWVAAEIALHGVAYAQQFIAGQLRLFSEVEAAHGSFTGFPVLALLLGCFPISVFALPNLVGDRQSQDELLESDTLAACKRSDFVTWMQLLFWPALLLFGIIRPGSAYYVSLCFFPLTYLGAVTIWRAIRWDVRPKATTVLLPVLGLAIGLTMMAAPYLGRHTEYLKPLFAGDAFALAALEAEVGWETWQGLPGLILAVSAMAGLYFWQKSRPWLAVQTVFAGGAVFAKLTMIFFLCNIEGHLQRAAIEFYKDKRGEHCAILPAGFKSCAQLFYAGKMPETTAKKIYFVAKDGNPAGAVHLPGCRELYRKNGFVFFEHVSLSDSSSIIIKR